MNPYKKPILILISIVGIYVFYYNYSEVWYTKKEIVVQQKDLNEKKLNEASFIPETKQPHETSTVYNLKKDEDKILEFYNIIGKGELKVFSQNKEDGVIQALLSFLNMTKPGFYVEFGTESGRECNTRYLREKFNWKGLLMDGGYQDASINLNRESITHDNILDLFEKHKVSDNIDIFSEDTDYADYWIVEKVLSKYHPKIVIHEVNQQPPDICVTVPKPKTLTFWDGSNFHGGSVCAFHCLAQRFNYSVVYCETAGVNCFWIRNDLLSSRLGVETNLIQKIINPQLLYKKPKFVYRSTNYVWHQIKC
jgi:hypothetical protein